MSTPPPVNPDDVEVRVKSRLRPHIPWFKDEQVFGNHGPQSRTALRMLIVAVVVALVVVAWASVIALNAANQAHHDLTVNHRNRLHDEAVIRSELRWLSGANRDLACSVSIYFRHQPRDHRPPQSFLQFLDKRYDCAHYHPAKPVLPRNP